MSALLLCTREQVPRARAKVFRASITRLGTENSELKVMVCICCIMFSNFYLNLIQVKILNSN